MIIFLTILFIILLFGSIAARYFAYAVPFLGAITTPLIIICIVVGAVWVLFIGIRIYNDLKGKK